MAQFKPEFARFKGRQARDKEAYVEEMFDAVSPTYDLLNRLLSFGMDRFWRRRLVKEARLAPGSEILDECTGTGDILFEFAQAVPGLRGVGLDLSKGMLEGAKAKNRFPGLSFIHGSVLKLPFKQGRFHAVTSAWGLRSILDLKRCFREQRRVLKKGGKILHLELSRPESALVRALYWPVLNLYLPLLGRLVSGHQSGYTYLRETIKGFHEPGAIVSFMEKAGFKNCRKAGLMLGIATLYTGEKP